MRQAIPSRIRLRDSVRAKLGTERGFLFEERTGRVYSLNGTAAFAAARLQEHGRLDDTLRALTQAFETDDSTARRDLETFVAQLIAEGLAEPTEDAPRG
jgi:hypothetical protein